MPAHKRPPASGSRRRRTASATKVSGVYDRLRDLIVRGVLAPGAPLIERPLAERLGVSRGSLRSALQRLEHEGFVRAASAGVYSRAVVTPLTAADMDDIYTLLAVLNGAAARQAALLPAAERAAIADDMQALNDQLEQLLVSQTSEFGPVYDLDDQLHRRYIDAAAGPRLRALLISVRSQGERYGRAYASAMGHAAMLRGPSAAPHAARLRSVLPDPSTSTGEHQAIIDALRAGDADAAEQAAVDNWRNAADRLRRVILAAGERGSF
jgi:DNA-binding GntR family transcriptional regulator